MDAKHATNLIQWLQSSNGYIHPSLQMRRIDPSDPTSHFGMFANEHISSEETLLKIPPSMVLDSTVKEPEITPMVCPLVHNLIAQMKLGDKSAYAPYIQYLKETQPPGQIPSAWSPAAQQLLVRLLGHVDFNLSKAHEFLPKYKDLRLRNHLPPMDPVGWVEHEWANDCNGGSVGTEEEQYAALLVVQRAWDDILIPVYDMMSHRNGRWLNTASNDGGVHRSNDPNDDANDDPIIVTALRDITAGEEIYTSYNQCEDCGGRIVSYGTGEILRDYGFVEDFPQSWIFPSVDLGWRIDERPKREVVPPEERERERRRNDGGDGDDENVYILTEWIEQDEPDDEQFEGLKSLHQDVVTNKGMIADTERYKYKDDIKDHEWDMMVQYMDAMDLALRVAIDWYEQNDDRHAVEEEGDDSCVEDGTCSVSLERYTSLEDHYEATNKEWYSSLTCDIDDQFKVFDDGTFKLIDDFKSQYQQINFLQEFDTRDTW